MVCGFYITLDRPASAPRLRARLSALVEAFPRLRTRILDSSSGPRWLEPDAGFDLDAQLATQKLAELQTQTEVVARLADCMHQPLDAELPPWQLSIVDGTTCHGLLLRWHHALSDGEGMLALLGALADSDVEPEPSRDLSRLSPALQGEFKPHARGTSRVRAPGLLWKLARQREPAARVLGSAHFRVLPILEQVDAAMLSRLLSRWSVSTTELLIALAAGAVARYEQRHGRSLPSLRMLSPLSDRTQHTNVQLGNFSRAWRPSIELGASLPTTAQLMTRVQAASREQLEHGKTVPYGVYRLVFALPGVLRDRLLGNGPKYIVNYVPWAAEPQWVAGARIERLHALTPMLPFHGCTFACGTYLGQLQANLVCDTQLLEQPELMVECLHEALEDTLAES
jgi:hypothetical protein